MNFKEAIEELQHLDPNNIGSWPTFVYVGACIFLLAALSAGGYYYFAIPKLETLAKLERTEKDLRQTFETKQVKAAALDAYKAQLSEMERSFGTMLRQLPSKAEVASLLNDIAQTRVASGLSEDLFKPDKEIRKEFYAELPNKIDVTGQFHDIAEFVSRVSALPRIVTINDVTLEPQSKSSSKMRMRATVNTYRYLSEEEGGK